MIGICGLLMFVLVIVNVEFVAELEEGSFLLGDSDLHVGKQHVKVFYALL